MHQMTRSPGSGNVFKEESGLGNCKFDVMQIERGFRRNVACKHAAGSFTRGCDGRASRRSEQLASVCKAEVNAKPNLKMAKQSLEDQLKN